MFIKSTVIIFLLSCFFSYSQEFKQSRPYQYILMGFDGSKNLSMWQETRSFAQDHNIEWTYFISAVYFSTDAKACSYKAPRHGASSAIGWGNKALFIKERLWHLLKADEEGHLISSHGVGHWNGDSWTQSEWDSEHSQFDYILKNAFHMIDEEEPVYWQKFVVDNINGFRAPLLGSGVVEYGNPSRLYKSLADNGHHFDTSLVRSSNYWPRKINGVWDYPLALIKVPGRSKKIVSMDYNMYVNDISGRRVLDGYMNYFKNNYYGNRAPLHIGHHFSKWRGGEYWWALKKFAKNVCHLPEVKCINYKKLTEYLESLDANQLSEFQAGNFKKYTQKHPDTFNEYSFSAVNDISVNDDITQYLKDIDSHSHDDLDIDIWDLSNSELTNLKNF